MTGFPADPQPDPALVSGLRSDLALVFGLRSDLVMVSGLRLGLAAMVGPRTGPAMFAVVFALVGLRTGLAVLLSSSAVEVEAEEVAVECRLLLS